MNGSRQLINLAGVLLVVVLLVAGVALVAMPMYAQSRATDLQTVTVAQENLVYQQQIAELTEAESRIDVIDANVAELRSEIAAQEQLDDVQGLIAAAARSVKVRVESVAVEAPASFVPREPAVEDDVETPVDDAATPDSATTEGPSEEADQTAVDTSPAVTEQLEPQRQILVTIVVDLTADDSSQGPAAGADEFDVDELHSQADAAAAFVDALRSGPRLVSPIEIELSDGKLTVAVLTYYRAEDES